MPPRVSVLMSVYNAEQYLEESIESILNQRFADFEFIIVDDGSLDAGPDLLARYQKRDPRVLVHRFDSNRGLSAALNFGMRLARGEYIARMDADDISLPNRLQEQVAFMDAHPEVGVCGTWVEVIDGDKKQVWKYPAKHEMIHAYMLFANMISHPSVMMRTSDLLQYDLFYNEQIQYAQDYELWSRAVSFVKFATLNTIHIQYRVGASLNRQKRVLQLQTHQLVYRNMLEQLNIPCTPEELQLHCKVSLYQFDADDLFLNQARLWLEKLSSINKRLGHFSPSMFDTLLGAHWTTICLAANVNNFHLCAIILQSSLPFRESVGIRKFYKLCKFFLKRP